MVLQGVDGVNPALLRFPGFAAGQALLKVDSHPQSLLSELVLPPPQDS